MKRLSAWLWIAALATALGGWSLEARSGEGNAPPGWRSGVGISDLANAEAAGDAAAKQAKDMLDGSPAKFVMITAAIPLVTPELIAGVAKHFDRDLIYGCQVASPLVAETNFPDSVEIDSAVGVSVWAVGGDANVTIATQLTDENNDNPYFASGSQLAAQLRSKIEGSKRPGKVIVTFGDQYNGSNIDFAKGMNDGFGDVYYPIVGGAAGNITAKVIAKGEITTGINVAMLLEGDFFIGQAMNGGTHTPQTADKTLATAIAEGKGAKPFFALIFNCRRRRTGMIERNQLDKELDVIKNRLPGINFFGFYGPGEIGAPARGRPAKGAGFTVVTAVFFRQQ